MKESAYFDEIGMLSGIVMCERSQRLEFP